MTVSPVLGSLNREGSTPFDFRSTSVEWMAPRDAGVFIAGIGDVVDSADVHERDVFSAVLTATLGTKKPT